MKHTAIALFCLCVAGYATADDSEPAPPPGMDHYLDVSSNSKSDITDARAEIIRSAGHTIGFRGGKAQRAYELVNALKARESTLNALYDFRTLISKEGWLPPVIDEAQDVAHITADQIRTASRVYQIILPERFVSNPPSWRTWLLAGLSTSAPSVREAGVIPKNSDERTVWQEAIEKGWHDGREGADHTLEANFNRLTRDYRGMLLYSRLLREGYVSRPEISDKQQSVSGNRKKLVTGDRVRNLRKHAEFNQSKGDWKPVINTESHHEANQTF
ncbi:type IV secretory system conjugative DNA transfer family protein [Serratia ficaria]|uniref:type IV secretory system conjugative DNA transfer family protein n=1 Tax=Serratia ficaria TaxID=61651 RepID=UPI00077C4ECD|nr:type IV secretory system conjugative DNA transfer family protein [Serratia ficaria]